MRISQVNVNFLSLPPFSAERLRALGWNEKISCWAGCKRPNVKKILNIFLSDLGSLSVTFISRKIALQTLSPTPAWTIISYTAQNSLINLIRRDRCTNADKFSTLNPRSAFCVYPGRSEQKKGEEMCDWQDKASPISWHCSRPRGIKIHFVSEKGTLA